MRAFDPERRFLETAPILWSEANSAKSANTTLIVGFDSQRNLKGIFKPKEGETVDGRANVEVGTFWRNEIAASRLNDALRPIGFDLVPTTVSRSVNGKEGSLQLFVNGAERAKYSDVLDRAAAELFKVFDYITGNSDRHLGNLLVVNEGGTKRPVFIDNGLSFPNGGNLIWKFPEMLRQPSFAPFLPRTIEFIGAIDPELVASVLAESGLFSVTDSAAEVTKTTVSNLVARRRCTPTEPCFVLRAANHHRRLRMTKLIVIAVLLANPSLSFAGPWEVDKLHSSINFSVKHWAVSTVHGQFDTINSATVSWDKPDFSDAQVEIVVDASSVDTHSKSRDAHLKSADFFDVGRFPTMSFKSKRVTRAAGGHIRLVGDLTLHGVTKEVTFDVTPAPEVTAMGVTKSGAEATATINRKDFGVSWNEALGAGNLAVSNDVKIDIELELTRKASAGAEKYNPLSRIADAAQRVCVDAAP